MVSMDKNKAPVSTVVDGLSRYISFQDVTSLDWNLEELAARVKKSKPGLFQLFGNPISLLLI
jgi:hypothetical protein